ncbi:MAG: hypothetical protein AAFX39_12025 [Pseudomonadota bacterium]
MREGFAGPDAKTEIDEGVHDPPQCLKDVALLRLGKVGAVEMVLVSIDINTQNRLRWGGSSGFGIVRGGPGSGRLLGPVMSDPSAPVRRRFAPNLLSA